MGKKEENKESKPLDEPTKAVLESKETESKNTEEEQEERNGIIPEDMDFRKFIGCGG